MARRDRIAYGRRVIEYEVFHAERETISIAVHPDQTVEVTAPVGTVHEDVHRRVVRRARWISGRLDYFEQFSPRTPPRSYVSGETHLYLGRRYRLKVAPGEAGRVRLFGGRLLVETVASEPEAVKAALQRWYADKARERLTERFEACWERFDPVGGREEPAVRVRRLRSRWGSLSKNRCLTLNVDLVRAPRECIDYVIYHELCHLEHQHHGPAFRALLERLLPDWERRKHRLEMTLA